VAREIREQVGRWIQMSFLMPQSWSQTEHLHDWFVALIVETPQTLRPGAGSIIILTIWELWLERNNRVFKKTIKTAQQIVHSICDAARNWATVETKTWGCSFNNG